MFHLTGDVFRVGLTALVAVLLVVSIKSPDSNRPLSPVLNFEMSMTVSLGWFQLAPPPFPCAIGKDIYTVTIKQNHSLHCSVYLSGIEPVPPLLPAQLYLPKEEVTCQVLDP